MKVVGVVFENDDKIYYLDASKFDLKKNITVVAKITDNKKVDIYSYQIIKNNTVIKEETNKLYTNPISFTLTEEGTYQIKAEATDEWGNKTIKTSEKYVIDGHH